MIFKHDIPSVIICEKDVLTMSLTGQDTRHFYFEAKAMKAGLCANNWDFLQEGIDEHGKTFVGEPVLVAYKFGKIGDKHNYTKRYDPEYGGEYADFTGPDAERIVGKITNAEVKADGSGTKWLYLRGYLWKKYALQLVHKIEKQKSMDVSVEVYAPEHEKGKGGTEVYRHWTGLGLTILGDDVSPAISGASMRGLLAAANFKDVFEERERIAAAWSGTEYTTKKGVKDNMNKTVMMTSLSEKFKDYMVLDFKQTEGENGIVLLAKDGLIHTYKTNADAAEIIPKNISAPAFSIVLGAAEEECRFDNGDAIVARIINEANTRCAAAEAKAAEADEKREKAEKIAADMISAENIRRCEAVESAINAIHEKCAATLPENERVSDERKNAIIELAKSGHFNNILSADGKWIGTQTAIKEYNAILGEARIAAVSNKNAEKRDAFSWLGASANTGNHEQGEFDADTLIRQLSTENNKYES